MKAHKIGEYRPNLQSLANMYWGGDCQPAKTNRAGFRYFSCAGHGGYLVDSRYLSESEKKTLEELVPKGKVNLLVQTRDDGEYVLGTDTSHFSDTYRRPKPYRYNPSLGEVRWVEYPIYIGEEDEMWCAIEKITGVRVETMIPTEKHDEIMEDCFERLTRRRGDY